MVSYYKRVLLENLANRLAYVSRSIIEPNFDDSHCQLIFLTKESPVTYKSSSSFSYECKFYVNQCNLFAPTFDGARQ